MKGGRGSRERGGEPLSLHLRVLKRFVQPLHGEGTLAEVIHDCGWACRPSRVTLASTDRCSDREGTAYCKTRYRYRSINNDSTCSLINAIIDEYKFLNETYLLHLAANLLFSALALESSYELDDPLRMS